MSNSKNRNAEHNLIFAGLGLQLGIIAKDKVIRAFTEWLFDKTKPLGEILVHQKAITPEQRKALGADKPCVQTLIRIAESFRSFEFQPG